MKRHIFIRNETKGNLQRTYQKDEIIFALSALMV